MKLRSSSLLFESIYCWSPGIVQFRLECKQAFDHYSASAGKSHKLRWCRIIWENITFYVWSYILNHTQHISVILIFGQIWSFKIQIFCLINTGDTELWAVSLLANICDDITIQLRLQCSKMCNNTGLILGLRPVNERRCYFVTTSIISWAQA